MQDIHFVWIGPELSILEQLTIKLYQRQNMNPILWTFDEIKNVPAGVTLKDAEEVLPKSTLFTYRRKGTGSNVSQWTDRFQLKLLQKFGGWYSQLDVACLRMPAECEYYFVAYDHTPIDVCVMKTPKDAPFLESCIKSLEQHVNKRTAGFFDWNASMRIIGNSVSEFELDRFIQGRTFERGYSEYMRYARVPPPYIDFIHWWNASCDVDKNNPIPDTFYHTLLKQVGLI